MKKRIEHFIRGVQYNGRDVSAVEPGYYGERFLRFIKGAVEGRTRVLVDGSVDGVVGTKREIGN